MTPQEMEDLFIRSLDVPMNPKEKQLFLDGLSNNPRLPRELSHYTEVRAILLRPEPATFGPYFASKLILKIQNTGVVIERQIFAFFKKYQLVAAGIVVALLMLNTVFSEQKTIKSIFGLEETTTTTEEVVSFDLYNNLNQ